MKPRISDEDLIRDLRQVAKKIGDIFTQKQYDNAGDYKSKTIAKRFGGWKEALKKAFPAKKNTERLKKMEIKDNFTERLLTLLQKPSTLMDLANNADASPKKVVEAIEKLKKSGVNIKEQNEEFWIEIADVMRPEDKEYRHTITTTKVAVISDTHLGSKEQQLTHLHSFYDHCEKRGVDTVFHIGDMFAGNGKVYRGQMYDIFINGIDDVVEYAANNYPRKEGITTKFITGNHDLSWYKSSGIDIGVQLDQARPDMEYLGQLGVYIYFDGIKAYFMHPTGGRAYAVSYKPQKFIEGFSSQNKPQLFLIGHYHSSGFFYQRNVYAFMVPCFEGQTSLFVAKGWMPEVGGWILDLNIDKTNTIASVNQEYISFPKLIKHDY